MRNPKPKWWLLYAVLPFGAALVVAADLLSPSAGWRMVAEGTASLMIIGAMGLWVRANRLALALRDDQSEARSPVRAWVDYSPPVTPRRNVKPLANSIEQKLTA